MLSQCVAPFLVSTKMTNMKVNRLVKSASGFAREALNTVGHSSYTSGCLSHAIQVRSYEKLLRDHSPTVCCCSVLMSLLLLPRHPAERGVRNTPAGLASYVVHPHPKALKNKHK